MEDRGDQNEEASLWERGNFQLKSHQATQMHWMDQAQSCRIFQAKRRAGTRSSSERRIDLDWGEEGGREGGVVRRSEKVDDGMSDEGDKMV